MSLINHVLGGTQDPQEATSCSNAIKQPTKQVPQYVYLHTQTWDDVARHECLQPDKNNC